jgi:hypothetical protein|eukprot:COSAG02_NODE_328_length_24547_cov_4.124141_4_plen_54_part_00
MYACIVGNLDAASALCEAGAGVNFVRVCYAPSYSRSYRQVNIADHVRVLGVVG